MQVVDVRNGGTLPGLADDDVVEVPARIGRGGAVPVAQRPLAPELLGLVQHVAAYERLAAAAAASGDREAARLALLAHPLVREYRLADSLSEPHARRCRAAAARQGRRESMSMGRELVVAVDGGGVKTDLALLDSSGALLSLVRGGGSQAHYIGVEGCVDVLESLLASALAEAGLGALERPFAATAQLLLAGMDLPEELSALTAAIEQLHWSERLVLGNDTEALLRAGTDRGWGIAVVCGTGINCLGIAGRAGWARGQVSVVRPRIRRLGRRSRRRSRRARRGRARRRRTRAADAARGRGARLFRARRPARGGAGLSPGGAAGGTAG